MLRFHEVVRKVPIAEDLVRQAVRLAGASRPGPGAPDFINQWVSWGAGLRAGQSLVLGAKARALLRGRFHAAPEDVRARILLAARLAHSEADSAESTRHL